METKSRLGKRLTACALVFAIICTYFVPCALAADDGDEETTPLEESLCDTDGETLQVFSDLDESETGEHLQLETEVEDDTDSALPDSAFSEPEWIVEAEEEDFPDEESTAEMEDEPEYTESQEEAAPSDSLWTNEMPAGFDVAQAVDGTVVSASWDEGAFPEGTTVQIESLSSAAAEELGQRALGDFCSLQGAFAVDITFENRDCDETGLQPCDESDVSITLELPKALPGEVFYLVHLKDDGNFEYISGAVVSVASSAGGLHQAISVRFHTASFSVYAILAAGQGGQNARRTYSYYVGDALFFSQTVTAGDTLADPGIPPLRENEEFAGWYRAGDDSGILVTVDELREEFANADIKEGETVSFTACIRDTFTVQYLDEEGKEIRTLKVYAGDSLTLTENYRPGDDSRFVFRGWLAEGEMMPPGSSIESVTSDLVLRPVLNRLFQLTFDFNWEDGSGEVLTVVPAEEGSDLALAFPGEDSMIRPGYQFAGWYRGIQEEGTLVLEEERVTGGTVSKDETFYAHWTPAEETFFTVKIWKQSVDDDYRIGLTPDDQPYYDEKNDLSELQKTYQLEQIIRLTGATGAEVSTADGYADCRNPDSGFRLAGEQVQNGNGNEPALIRADGETVVDLYFDRQIMELTFADVREPEFVEDDRVTENVYGTDGTSWFPIFRTESTGYVESLDYDETVRYYGTDDGTSFFRIWYKENATSYREATDDSAYFRLSDDGKTYVRVYLVNGVWRLSKSDNSEEFSGTRYKNGPLMDLWLKSSSSSVGVAYTGSRFVEGQVVNWYRQTDGVGERYEGVRYRCDVRIHDVVFTGLYGQSFQKYEYIWPGECAWNGTVFTDSFTDMSLFPETDENGTVRTGTLNEMEPAAEEEQITVHYYIRQTDGTYGKRASSVTYLDHSADGMLVNPFAGMTFAEYACTGSAEVPGEAEAWKTGETDPGGTLRCVDRNGNTHLHVRFAPKSCTLSFRDAYSPGEDGIIGSVAVPYGAALADYQAQQPENPARTGFVFAGWFLDPYGLEPFRWEGEMDTAEQTVYAAWEKCHFRIVMDLCDDDAAPAEFGPGLSFLVPDSGGIPDEVPVRDGYRFCGFFTDAACTDEFAGESLVTAALPAIELNYPESDEYAAGLKKNGTLIHAAERDQDHVLGKLTLYASWEKLIPVSVYLHYDGNGGSGTQTDDGCDYFGQEYAAAHGTCIPPDGMAFLCWTYIDAQSGEEMEVYPSHLFPLGSAERKLEETADRIIYTVTLKAKFVEKQAPKTVTVIFDANGGEGGYSFAIPENEEFIIPDAAEANVSREGYRLAYWYFEDDGDDVPFLPGDSVAASSRGSNTLYAQWERLNFAVSFILDADDAGTVPQKQQVPYGETASKPADPGRSGFRFMGWTVNGTLYDFSTPVTQDLVLRALWGKEYRVFYRILSSTGLELESVPVDDAGYLPGETVSVMLPSQPLPGYDDFSGWFHESIQIQDGELIMPDGDVTLCGTVTPVRYSVQYDLAGGSMPEGNPASYTVEDDGWTLNPPARTGYDFLGWTGSNGSEPQTEVSVAKGSTGDRIYTAVWTPSTHTRYTVTVHYPETWEMPDTMPNATLDLEQRTAVYECYGVTDAPVTAQAFLNPDDHRLSCDAEHEGSILQGKILADGSLELHVFLKRAEYQYTVEFFLRDSDTVIGAYSGTGLPDEHGALLFEVAMNQAVLVNPYSDYLESMAIDGSPVYTVTRDQAVVRVPVVITVSVERMDSRESYQNGEVQQGYNYEVLTGSGYTTVSADQHLAVSGLLPGDCMHISMTPAAGSTPDTYQAQFDGVSFTHGGEAVSYYSFSGFDSHMSGLTILDTYTVIWMNGEEELFTDPYVVPNTLPEYKGETPLKDPDPQYVYVFNGWDPAVSEARQRVTRYSAKFSKVYRTFTITWQDEDGTVLRIDTVQYGERPGFQGTRPHKADDSEYSYTFKGWTPGIAEASEDAVYRAAYDRTPKSYTVSYLIDGEPSGNVQTYAFGETVQLEPVPVKAGYTFSSWSSNEVTAENGSFVMPACNVVFSGHFTPLSKETFDPSMLTEAQKPTAKPGLRYTAEDQTLLNALQELPEDFTVLRFSTDGGETWSSELPAGLNAGIYNILAEYTGSSRYNSFRLEPISVTIRKAELPDFRILIHEKAEYSGAQWNLLAGTPDLPDGVTIEYRVTTSDGETVSDWSTSSPQATQPGQYKVWYRIDGGSNYQSVPVTQVDNGNGALAVIEKGTQSPPSGKPQASSGNPGTLTVSPVFSGQEYFVKPAGELPTAEDWMSARSVSGSAGYLEFDHLTPGSEMVVYTRKAETDYLCASGYLAGDPVSVAKEAQERPSSGITVVAGITSITVKPAFADQEYCLNNSSAWVSPPAGQSELTFEDLHPDTEYRLTTRMAETATKSASEPGDPVTVRTREEALLTEVRKGNSTVPLIEAPGLTNDLARSLLSEEEKNMLRQGKTLTISLLVTDITASVSGEERNLITQKADSLEGKAVTWLCLDLSLVKQLEGEAPVSITEITNNQVEVSLTLPEAVRNAGSSVKRTFLILTVHNGEAESLTPEVNGNTLTFSASRFSTYAFLYLDQVVDTAATDSSEPASGVATLSNSNGGSTASGTPVAAIIADNSTDADAAGSTGADTDDTGKINGNGKTGINGLNAGQQDPAGEASGNIGDPSNEWQPELEDENKADGIGLVSFLKENGTALRISIPFFVLLVLGIIFYVRRKIRAKHETNGTLQENG